MPLLVEDLVVDGGVFGAVEDVLRRGRGGREGRGEEADGEKGGPHPATLTDCVNLGKDSNHTKTDNFDILRVLVFLRTQ